MSENVLDEPYATNYYNVYMKGALIGMCIDIIMRKERKGERSMLSLMKELSNKYGKNKPFEDDKIIEEMTTMTYPSIGEFFKTYVEGDVPINYDEFFDMVGLIYGNSEVPTNYIFAGGQNIIFDADPQKGEIFFSEMALKNSFWASQGVQVGDVIKKVDAKELTLMNAQEIITGMYGWQEGQEIDVELNRNGETVMIKTILTKATAESESLIEDPNASDEKVALRNAWLKK
jgi:predicted metalloprotease with PDZ domain